MEIPNHSFNDSAALRCELIIENILERTDDGRKYWKVNDTVSL